MVRWNSVAARAEDLDMEKMIMLPLEMAIKI
jgi:hypothetical protein